MRYQTALHTERVIRLHCAYAPTKAPSLSGGRIIHVHEQLTLEQNPWTLRRRQLLGCEADVTVVGSYFDAWFG